MSDIKFACPHCSQHIACDGDYAELGIECPSCGGPMVVPRLSSSPSEHGGMVLVASSSPPPPRPTQRIPPLNPLGGPFWPREITDAPNENPVLATCWIACLFATFVLAFVLAGNGFKPQAIFACVVIGGLLTGYLRAKGSSKPTAQALLAGLGFAVVLLLVTPILLLGILFIGCAACAR